MSFGPGEIIVIALIVLLLFGSQRLADIGKGLGDGIRNFKRGFSDEPEPEKAKAPDAPQPSSAPVDEPALQAAQPGAEDDVPSDAQKASRSSD